MSQFNAQIVYIKHEDNSVADALSRFPSKSECANVEKIACHPDVFCTDEHTNDAIVSVMLTKECNPWQTASSLT